MFDWKEIDSAICIAHLIQITMVFNSPIKCVLTCLRSGIAGLSIIPTFVFSRCFGLRWWFFIFIPFATACFANYSFAICDDENWYIWYIQGLTIPSFFCRLTASGVRSFTWRRALAANEA